MKRENEEENKEIKGKTITEKGKGRNRRGRELEIDR
jgi:hypothetical protein